MMAADDLVDHFKLAAQVFPEHTSHITYQVDRSRGVRETIETKWTREDVIGQGSFGRVWREIHNQPDGKKNTRAVKVLEKRSMDVYKVDIKKELLALAKFSKDDYRHAEVFVSFLGWFESDQNIFLAMEYFSHGDLARNISYISTEEEVRQITTNLLDGLMIMNAEGFAHRDLKPQLCSN